MRSRWHAIGLSMITAVLPLLGWLSTVIVGLVCLRHGAAAGALVLMWTTLPIGVAFYYVGDPTAALWLVGTFVMALALRESLSWEIVLICAVIFAGLGAVIFEFTAQGLMATFVEFYMEYLRQVDAGLVITEEQAKTLLLSAYGVFQAYAMVVLLIIARWSQSALYNKGGFRQEFHQLRLSPIVSSSIVALILVCYTFSEVLGRWLPLLTVPLVFAAIGFIHWLVTNKELSKNWLGGFYASLIVLLQLVYPFLLSLAVMDSWFNIRNRIQTIQKD